MNNTKRIRVEKSRKRGFYFFLAMFIFHLCAQLFSYFIEKGTFDSSVILVSAILVLFCHFYYGFTYFFKNIVQINNREKDAFLNSENPSHK
mgnify:CR=1 FL=1